MEWSYPVVEIPEKPCFEGYVCYQRPLDRQRDEVHGTTVPLLLADTTPKQVVAFDGDTVTLKRPSFEVARATMSRGKYKHNGIFPREYAKLFGTYHNYDIRYNADSKGIFETKPGEIEAHWQKIPWGDDTVDIKIEKGRYGPTISAIKKPADAEFDLINVIFELPSVRMGQEMMLHMMSEDYHAYLWNRKRGSGTVKRKYVRDKVF